jgi:PilZ domain
LSEKSDIQLLKSRNKKEASPPTMAFVGNWPLVPEGWSILNRFHPKLGCSIAIMQESPFSCVKGVIPKTGALGHTAHPGPSGKTGSMATELKDHQCGLIALRKHQEKGNRQHEQQRRYSKLQTDTQYAAETLRTITDDRWKPRFKMETELTIISRTRGMLKGHTVDISESGLAAMLTIEVPLGEIVELSFTLPDGPVTLSAMVRQRNAFRYGLEFIVPNTVSEAIRRTCRDLAVDQHLFAGLTT